MKGPRADVSGLLSRPLPDAGFLTATRDGENEEDGPTIPTPPPPRELLGVRHHLVFGAQALTA